MSVASVVTEGFGFGGFVVTQGFDIGEAAIPDADASILTQAFGAQTDASAFLVTEGFQPGAAVEPPPPSDGLPVKGGRVRKKRYAVQIDGEWLSFASFDALQEYLEALREKELEKVEEQVERVVQRVIRTGKAPRKPAPKIQVKGPQEVKEMVDEINAHLDRIYWRKVAEELAARADEDDIEILALL